MRKWLLLFASTALLAAVYVVAGAFFGWPPPRLVLEYGLPPQGGPTGRTWTDPDGLEFVEIAPGYCRFEPRDPGARGDLLGRFCEAMGLPFGNHPQRDRCSRWIEAPRRFWLSARPRKQAEAYPYHWRGRDPGVHQGSACPVCRDARLGFATTGQLQFAAEFGALRFGNEGIPRAWRSPEGVLMIHSTPSGIEFGPVWCGRPDTGTTADPASECAYDEFRWSAYLVWVPPDLDE